jgi:hypothetical protein
MGWNSLTSKVGMTTLVSVSPSLVLPSMLLSLLRRYLSLYRGPQRAVTPDIIQFIQPPLKDSITQLSQVHIQSPGGHSMNDSPLREDVWAVLEVEAVDVPGGEEGPPVLTGRGDHGRDQPTSAGPRDAVEVVSQHRVRTVQLLKLRLQEGQDGARDEAADAARMARIVTRCSSVTALADDDARHRSLAAQVTGHFSD